jgi:CRP-like cAMP-binding protein
MAATATALADMLKTTPLFCGLPSDELARLAAVARQRTFRRDEVIFHQGDAGTSLFVIVEGTVKVIEDTDPGGETILAILGPGDCFGELSLFDEEPRSARIETLERVVTIAVARDAFLDFALGNRVVTQHLFCALAHMVRRLTDMVGDLTTLDVEGRLARKLLRLAEEYGREVDGAIEIQLSVTHEELAAMIGAVRPSVNKLIVGWESRGIIERRSRAGRGRYIAILDADRLRRRIM